MLSSEIHIMYRKNIESVVGILNSNLRSRICLYGDDHLLDNAVADIVDLVDSKYEVHRFDMKNFSLRSVFAYNRGVNNYQLENIFFELSTQKNILVVLHVGSRHVAEEYCPWNNFLFKNCACLVVGRTCSSFPTFEFWNADQVSTPSPFDRMSKALGIIKSDLDEKNFDVNLSIIVSMLVKLKDLPGAVEVTNWSIDKDENFEAIEAIVKKHARQFRYKSIVSYCVQNNLLKIEN